MEMRSEEEIRKKLEEVKREGRLCARDFNIDDMIIYDAQGHILEWVLKEYKILVKGDLIEIGPYTDDEDKEYFIRVSMDDDDEYSITAFFVDGDTQQLNLQDLNDNEIEVVKKYFEHGKEPDET